MHVKPSQMPLQHVEIEPPWHLGVRIFCLLMMVTWAKGHILKYSRSPYADNDFVVMALAQKR